MAAAAGDWSDIGVDRTRLVVEAARDMAVQRLSEGGGGELPGFPRSGRGRVPSRLKYAEGSFYFLVLCVFCQSTVDHNGHFYDRGRRSQ